MKKLFLSSYFSKVSPLLLPLLHKDPKKCKLVFISTAANPYEEKSWLYEDRNKLVEMGFEVSDFDLCNKSTDQILNELKGVDVIFVSGGNTYYLLEKAKKSGFDKVINNLVNKGLIYVGSSAGSVLACPTIEHIQDLDDKTKADLKSYEGLRLIDFLILPHYGEPKYEVRFRKIMDEWGNKGYEITTLTNSQAVICTDGNIQVSSCSD